MRWANERMRLAVLLGECAAPYMGHHGRDHGLNRRHMKGFHLWRECLCDLCSTNLRTLSRRSPEMSQENGQPRRASGSWSLPPNARSTTRVALVACTLLATVAALLIVTLQTRSAVQALEEAGSHTLRDYTGYAGRMMGAEMLRRFSEQRAGILAPVAGSAHRNVPAPTLQELASLGAQFLDDSLPATDPHFGYFRLDPRSGAIWGIGHVSGPFAAQIADTLRALRLASAITAVQGILAVPCDGVPCSVAYVPLVSRDGRVAAIYGYTYTRSRGMAAVAKRVFRETPLLPISFSGTRWNYDTTQVRSGEVTNDSLLAIRIKDRGERLLWETPGAARVFAQSPYTGRAVFSTLTGGFVIESALEPVSETSLIPGMVRRAQRWSMRSLIAFTVLLAILSLIALRGERIGAKARRVEAMQQLALGLRHEVNNALASVLLNAELLSEERLNEGQLEHVEAIVEQADRMRKVLRRLEQVDRLDVLVPYLNEGLMVDLSLTSADRDVRPAAEEDPVNSSAG